MTNSADPELDLHCFQSQGISGSAGLGLINYQQYTSIFYSKYPKILYTKCLTKIAYAESADPDQTVPEGAVWSRYTLFAIPLSILRKNYIKSKIWAKKVWNKVFKILGHLPYQRFCSLLTEYLDTISALVHQTLKSLIRVHFFLHTR